MQLALKGIYNEVPEKKNSTKNVVLTERDFEILEFVMDMKFAGVEEVFEKFFKVTQSKEPAKSSEWARKRLFQLEQAKFLKSVRSFSESTRYYCSTFKAYYALTNFKPETSFCKPAGGFDQRTFIHDRAVLKSRLHLEKTGIANAWISDRKLRSSAELTGILSSHYVPDAIYVNAAGLKVAFELEIAVKAKSRYQDKIKKYVQPMRNSNSSSKTFERVQIVCFKECVREFLVKETRIYGGLFEIISLNTFFSSEQKQVAHEVY